MLDTVLIAWWAVVIATLVYLAAMTTFWMDARKQRRARKVAESKLDVAVDVLDSLVFEGRCELDHHGYCQAHNWFEEGQCPNARALQFLAEVKETEC